MDKLTQYRNCVTQLIQKYAGYLTSQAGDVEVETIFDTNHDYYQLVTVGWKGEHRIHGCSIHIDIKQGKIWIQYNGTEVRLAHELVEMGVPKEDIVLGFQPVMLRSMSGFAVG
jgi:hypothetical protein